MNETTVEKGRSAENVAVNHLQKKGYRILARNFRHRRYEIDVVAWHQGTIVFIEVKMRSSGSLDTGPSPSYGQIKRILSAANSYLHTKAPIASNSRFDVIRIRKKANTHEIEHLEDAFDASSFLV
jgi:putative endonuclease